MEYITPPLFRIPSYLSTQPPRLFALVRHHTIGCCIIANPLTYSICNYGIPDPQYTLIVRSECPSGCSEVGWDALNDQCRVLVYDAGVFGFDFLMSRQSIYKCHPVMKYNANNKTLRSKLRDNFDHLVNVDKLYP
jgi:hypothetical protein